MQSAMRSPNLGKSPSPAERSFFDLVQAAGIAGVAGVHYRSLRVQIFRFHRFRSTQAPLFPRKNLAVALRRAIQRPKPVPKDQPIFIATGFPPCLVTCCATQK